MLVFLAAFVALASADCPLGTVYHQEFNRCYKFVSTAQPFYLAEEACISIGGHVVSVSSGYENAMLSGPPARCQSGWTYFAQTNSCYKNFLWASFGNAENICKGNGGHLASIHSLEENNFVATLGMSGMAYTNGANLTWIGLKQATYPTSKDWSWTDGSPVYFMFWAPSQPDDAGGSEHCVEIFSDHIGKDPAEDGNYQRWNDISCATNMRSYVC
ncbi:lectin C-type domain protein [Teladorsagia circumcincta]|uniref:Lectin C-type domain protein n=1 Tax=Teladorsagia circumcincta TaxID=45464 RepID=A0A2G9UGQ8_TELCI|nr:lectin C-type domain protein [Teladorsagia circumcincta]